MNSGPFIENKDIPIKSGLGSFGAGLLKMAGIEATWEFDVASGKTYVPDMGYKSLFGYNLTGKFIDKGFWESKLHPDEREALILELAAVMANESVNYHVMEYRFLKADASYTFIRDRFFIVRQNGAAVKIMGVKEDISGQKTGQQRLNLLESVLANASDSVMILESVKQGSSGAKVIYVNEAFTRMSGYTLEDVTGKTPALFKGPETSRLQFEKLHMALRDHLPCEVELVSYKKNGDAYWVEIAIAPVNNPEGFVSHFIVIEKDITDRKTQDRQQENLINELTQNNIDLRQFSYITSHNLRGPIASLLGLCKLLEHFKIEDKTLKQILDGVRKATHMFDDTIKDLTTVLNVRDRTSIPKQDLQFFPVYEKALAQSEVLIDYCGAEIRADFDSAPSVNYNKAYLESIFSNLITNAIKYRSSARKLKVLIKTEEAGNYIVLKFTDNGLGIDLELHKEKMFRLYQRFHEHAEGKGLGLFLIKSQLEALNGSIDIESKLDEGTTFILKFKR
ncbi:MAG: PAS domain-containing protein [Bacteroidota bacterium]